MASSERALIFVESATDLVASKGRNAVVSSASKDRSMLPKMQDKSNYVIKIHIGDETMYNPVRIDVSTGKSSRIGLDKTAILEEDATFNSSGSSSGQSSPRSDMTPPPRINTGSIRFGSETSESDTESDVSSEYRPIKCPTAQFAMREMLEIEPIRSASTLTNEIAGYQLRRQDSAPIQAFKEASSSFGSNLLNTRNHMSLQRSFSHCPSTPLSLIPEKVNNSMSLSNNNTVERSFCNTLDLARKNLLKTADMKPAKQGGKLQIKQEEIIDENGFHLDEINDVNSKAVNEASDSLNNFAGYKDIFARTKQDGAAQIKSEKGTIRGVKNRVRDGIATFLQSNDIKNFSEKEQGRVVVYVTSMGVVRDTFMRCHKVKQILRTLLVKFDERDCYMNRSIQNEIRQRLPPRAYATANGSQTDAYGRKQNFGANHVSLPQVFLEGQHLGDAETIEKLNETGELRDLLRPYKSLSVLTTCDRCGGFRMLPCPICNGSKKSVHRNHFTTEFVALKCMHCDPSGLVSCDVCNSGGS